ncbi:hypothetical protein C8R45DRAFT_974148, partial [Mycena sanguinolenta]
RGSRWLRAALSVVLFTERPIPSAANTSNRLAMISSSSPPPSRAHPRPVSYPNLHPFTCASLLESWPDIKCP